MKTKKLLMTALVIFALVYVGIIGIKLYDDHKYKLALYEEENYIEVNDNKYLSYHKKYKEATIQDVIDIVNNGLDVYDYSTYLLDIIDDDNTKYDNIEKYLSYIKDNTDYNIHQTILIVNNYFDKLEGYDLNQLLSFAEEKYYINKNLKRYLDYYHNNSDISYRQVIEAVNCNRDREFYKDIYPTDTSDKLLLLVNKYYYLSNDYIPDNLIYFDSKYVDGDYSPQLVKEAYEAFIEMHDAAYEGGYDIKISSINAYRDYWQQEKTYKFYEGVYGTEGADTCSARAGFSEHQTGLTIDTTVYKPDGSSFDSFEQEYRWLRNNSWQFGFIFRYQGEKEFYTGYEEEQWHYRYVGKNVALYIHDNGITFDEYYEFFIKDNNISEIDFVNLFN